MARASLQFLLPQNRNGSGFHQPFPRATPTVKVLPAAADERLVTAVETASVAFRVAYSTVLLKLVNPGSREPAPGRVAPFTVRAKYPKPIT